MDIILFLVIILAIVYCIPILIRILFFLLGSFAWAIIILFIVWSLIKLLFL